MICQLCKKRVKEKMKTVDGIDIFECQECQLGFVDQTNRNNLDPQQEYNLEGYKENERSFRVRFGKLIEKIYGYKKTGKVLDVGAGYGLLSSMLYDKGYAIDIVEPTNILHYLRGKKNKHHKTTIEKFCSRRKIKYDIILLMDTIEHFKDPFSVLRKLHSVLNRKGIIVIQTPNYRSLMAKLCINWSWWMVSDHKFFFSPRSTRLLLQKAEFTVDFFSTYEDFYDFKKNLDGNFTMIENSFTRKITKGFYFTFFFPLYMLLRKIFWFYGYGGLILTIGV